MRNRLLLIFSALALAACGGSNKESLEKKVKSLQDEVTRLQNAQDRVAERLQSMEIQALRERAAPAQPKAEETAVVRPPLKIVKLAPGSAAPEAPSQPMPEAQPEDDGAPRPVLKDHGQKPPAWQKAPGKPGATSTRAPVLGVSQNGAGSGPVAPAAPRGTP